MVLELQIRQIVTADGITVVNYALCLGEWQGSGDELHLERQPNPEELTAEFSGELTTEQVTAALLPSLQAHATEGEHELCL